MSLDDSGDSKYNNLLKENKILKEKIKELENNSLSNKIDNFVDEWFDKNNDDIDIGRIGAFNVFGKEYEIDIMPDVMEKAIYKKSIKIMVSLLCKTLC